jgi:hypothetical protein
LTDEKLTSSVPLALDDVVNLALTVHFNVFAFVNGLVIRNESSAIVPSVPTAPNPPAPEQDDEGLFVEM